MQTKKRAKPVKFGKASPPKTEKRETPPVSQPEAKEETPQVEEISLVEKQTPKSNETKKIELEVSHTHLTEEISEPADKPSEDKNVENADDVQEVEENKETAITENDEKQSEKVDDENEESETSEEVAEDNEEKQHEEEEKENEEQPEEAEGEKPTSIEPFSKEELSAAESSGWKQLVLYFFLIAFVAFLLGLAFIGGIYYTGRSIKLPSVRFPTFARKMTPTKIPIPTATAMPTPTPNLSAYSVEVLNGSGITGEAAKLKSELTAVGFKVSSTGNADNSNYTTTQIAAEKSVNKAYINKLEETLKQWYTVEVVQPSANASSTSDVVVTIGSSVNK